MRCVAGPLRDGGRLPAASAGAPACGREGSRVTKSTGVAVAAARALLLMLAAGAPASAADAPPDGGFSLPIACRPGTECWVMNYPDVAAGPEERDPWCGPRSYDGHEGVDIAIRDRAAMRAGVAVLAAAGGTVRAVRDGMDDRPFVEAGRAALTGQDCGNGVVIDHGGGWESQYCHLRRGSVAVRPGAAVTRGQRLGLVGLSGRTEFPHIHLTVRRDGEKIDPSTGRPLAAGCGRGDGTPLWRPADALPYSAGDLYAAGFAPGPVPPERIKDNAASPASLRRDSGALVLWAAMFGVRRGDRVGFEIVAPDGGIVLKREQRIDRDQAWRLEFSGLRRSAPLWPSGRWQGRVTLTRDGARVLAQTRDVELTIR